MSKILTTQEQEIIASDKLADAVLAATVSGASGAIVANEVVKLAMTMIQAAQGGRREAVPIVLRRIADHIEQNPETPVTIN